MQGTFNEIIRGSFEWTKTILLNPFKIKKWFFLTLIALLAADISGFNFNINLPFKGGEKEAVFDKEKSLESAQCVAEKQILHSELIKKNAALVIAICVILIILVVIVFILWMWIYSRFSFVFTAAIIRNDASIKKPFREFKKVGNSYFKFNFLFTAVIFALILVFAGILIAGIFILKDAPVLLNILLAVLWGILFVSVLCIMAVIGVVIRDLVSPVMMRNDVCFVEAWKLISPVIFTDKVSFIKYFLIKVGLRILAGMAGGIAALCVMFAMMIPIGLIGVILYAVSHLIPEALKWGYFGLLILFGIICLLFVIFIINSILLPIPVFFKTFSLKFLARLDQRQNLFRIG
jgi:hypothetical protein